MGLLGYDDVLLQARQRSAIDEGQPLHLGPDLLAAPSTASDHSLLNAAERLANPQAYTSVEGRRVVVQDGDTLSGLAGTSDPAMVGAVMAANNLDGSAIRPGDVLFLPNNASAYGDNAVSGDRLLARDNASRAMKAAWQESAERAQRLGLSGGVDRAPVDPELERFAAEYRARIDRGPQASAYDLAAEQARQQAKQKAGTTIGLAAGGLLTGWAAGAQLAGAPDNAINDIGVANAGLVTSLDPLVRYYETVKPKPVDPRFDTSVDGFINPGKQSRHVTGTKDYESRRGSYFEQVSDAQDVLEAYQNGQAVVVARGNDGGPIVRVDGAKGFNHNPRAGYPDQPTNLFWIKGSSSVSVVPVSPTKGQ